MNIHTPMNITIHASSPKIEQFEPRVIVTLPTYKRPEHLLQTLESLRDQQTEHLFAVIVMENDDEGLAGANAAAPIFNDGELEGYVIIAHDRGNCNAYNAGWYTALTRFPVFERLVVIDDDELADPCWIEQHLITASKFGADIVGGPQVPVFGKSELQCWENHPVFLPAHHRTGPVDYLYSSGNLSLSRRILERMPFPWLDLRFNFLGGGDSDFLSRCVQSGFKLAWCSEAIVRETQPERRTESDWIRARALRNGVISTLVEKRKRSSEAFGNTKTLMKSLLLLGASPIRSLINLVSGNSWSISIYPILVGVGRMMGHFGVEAEQYRNAEKN